jgi:hypothetical protein
VNRAPLFFCGRVCGIIVDVKLPADPVNASRMSSIPAAPAPFTAETRRELRDQ